METGTELDKKAFDEYWKSNGGFMPYAPAFRYYSEGIKHARATMEIEWAREQQTIELGQWKEANKEQAERIAELEAEVAKLAAFKKYVHDRLDAAGVPVDPESPHKEKGCRIGGRLDIVLDQQQFMYRVACKERDEAYAELEGLKTNYQAACKEIDESQAVVARFRAVLLYYKANPALCWDDLKSLGESALQSPGHFVTDPVKANETFEKLKGVQSIKDANHTAFTHCLEDDGEWMSVIPICEAFRWPHKYYLWDNERKEPTDIQLLKPVSIKDSPPTPNSNIRFGPMPEEVENKLTDYITDIGFALENRKHIRHGARWCYANTQPLASPKDTPEHEGIQIANRILANADRARQLIGFITVNKSNFEHIASTGKINGSLYNDLEDMLTRLMIEYWHKGKKEAQPLANTPDRYERYLKYSHSVWDNEFKKKLGIDDVVQLLNSSTQQPLASPLSDELDIELLKDVKEYLTGHGSYAEMPLLKRVTTALSKYQQAKQP